MINQKMNLVRGKKRKKRLVGEIQYCTVLAVTGTSDERV